MCTGICHWIGRERESIGRASPTICVNVDISVNEHVNLNMYNMRVNMNVIRHAKMNLNTNNC